MPTLHDMNDLLYLAREDIIDTDTALDEIADVELGRDAQCVMVLMHEGYFTQDDALDALDEIGDPDGIGLVPLDLHDDMVVAYMHQHEPHEFDWEQHISELRAE